MIDDDVFAAVALSRYKRKAALRKFAFRKAHNVEKWTAGLTLAGDFEIPEKDSLERLGYIKQSRMPGPQTDSGQAFEELKAEMVGEGLYRFDDMTVLANRALDDLPHLAARLNARFPVVFLDEAQDTGSDHLALIESVFGGRSTVQRLGDVNQTIFDFNAQSTATEWQPGDNAIDLGKSRRFGQDIADFASRLTVRKQQNILGAGDMPGHRVLFLFEADCIDRVLPAYAEEILGQWPDGLPDAGEAWAVASRHQVAKKRGKNWLKSLVDYHPPYRPERAKRADSPLLCVAMRKAVVALKNGKSTSEIMGDISAAVIELLERMGFEPPEGMKLTGWTVWRCLDASSPGAALALRRPILDRVLVGEAPWANVAWGSFCDELLAALDFVDIPKVRLAPVLEYLEYGLGGTAGGDAEQGERNIFRHNGVSIRLGSIHSRKGRTLGAVLVLETEIHKGPKKEEQIMDLATVLPHAFGLEDRDFSADETELAAATNVFVACTRPRHMLCLAIRKEAVSEDLLNEAEAQGWLVRDLTEDTG